MDDRRRSDWLRKAGLLLSLADQQRSAPMLEKTDRRHPQDARQKSRPLTETACEQVLDHRAAGP